MAIAEPSSQVSGAFSRIARMPFRSLAALPAPKRAVLAAIAVAGVAAAATTLALGLTNNEVDNVGVRVFLIDWITLNYIGAGLIAWWRRPDSRFGPLMVAAGFVNFLGTLDWSTVDVFPSSPGRRPHTFGVGVHRHAGTRGLRVDELQSRGDRSTGEEALALAAERLLSFASCSAPTPSSSALACLQAMGTTWRRYYDAAGDEPRETLLFALDRFDAETGANDGGRFAVDLGCGAGRDTAELLRRGWRVLAIDAEEDAIERLLSRDDLGSCDASRLETKVARFEDASWPAADLINSSYALPFCPPKQFTTVWQRIVASLRCGGRFSGQLFGDRDGWATAPDMSFQTRQEAAELMRGLELERFAEVEEDGKTAMGDRKYWHVFHVVARKR